MSCPDFVISAGGRASVGINQSISAGDYPFVAPSADIAGLVADMHFAYDDPGLYTGQPPKKYPFSIKYLSGLGCLAAMSGVPSGVHAADIRIVDATGAAVFDSFANSDVTYTKTEWSADYDIHEWRGEFAVCRIVTYKTWPGTDKNDNDATTARNYASKIAPASAVIDSRAVYRMPKRLLSMRVKTGSTVTNKAKGEIVFKNGYNTEITASPATIENFRANTRISLSGAAGSGLGRFFNCSDTVAQPVITSINGVSPNAAGDFVMGGKDCLWNAHSLVAAAPEEEENAPAVFSYNRSAGIKFGGDCKACCSCEDYVAVAEYMNQVAYRYQLIGQRAQEVYTQHETNVANWETATCDVGEVLKMATRASECGAIDLAITLCNTCNTCIPASTLILDLYVPEPPDSVVPVKLKEIFISRRQRLGVHGNQLVHGLDCSYTKINGATVDAAVTTVGSFERQFGLMDVINTSGQPDPQQFPPELVRSTIPQIKPYSLVWPTYVPNVFTAGFYVTEYMYDLGAEAMACDAHDADTIWAANKNNPVYFWRSSPAFTNTHPWQAVNVYGIRLEDNDPLPPTDLVSIGPYLAQKYYSARVTGDPTIAWGSVGTMTVDALGELTMPDVHNRWWSPIGTGNVIGGTADVIGNRDIRTYERVNEAEIGAIISEHAAVAALADRLAIPAVNVVNDIFIGALTDDFISDIVPTVGLSVVDKFGLLSSWSPEGSGAVGFWPATIKSVHVEDNVIWLRIARPTAPADRNVPPSDPNYANVSFPALNIDFELEPGVNWDDPPIKTKSAAARSLKTIRFYNMQIFGEHAKLDGSGGFVNPWVIDQYPETPDPTNYWFNGIGAVATSVTTNAEWSKPDRYIRVKTPRRIKINTPAVMPAGTIQIDLRVTLRELAFLAYAGEYTTADWPTCADNAVPLKFCDNSELSAASLALYDGADRMSFKSGAWPTGDSGEDGIFYSHIPTKTGLKISHPDGGSDCTTRPPAACLLSVVPKYWQLLRWTKTFDDIVLPEDLLTEAEYKEEHACTDAGVFNGVVELTPQESDDPNVTPPTRVKVCGFTSVGNGKPLTKRKITPRGPYPVELVLTGRKPTASNADISKQHILADGCEEQAAAKKAFITKTLQLNCDLDGRTQSC